MKVRIVRRGGDGSANQIRAFVAMAGLARDHAEQMQRVGMRRLNRQNLPIDRRGFPEFPGIKMPLGQLHRLFDRDL